MKRRTFIKQFALAAACGPQLAAVAADDALSKRVPAHGAPDVPATDWLERWERHILAEARTRYCDREMGEELGWLVSPFLNGFYHGYRATRDAKWVEQLVGWTDAWIGRALKEPDGFIGWPKGGTGGVQEENLYSDSLLGEAMALRPAVLMAGTIRKTPELSAKFEAQAKSYLECSAQIFEKWVARGCWREVKDGGLWVVPAFGIDRQTGQWTEGYSRRATEGFSNPANKQNHIARWLLAMSEVTGKAVYRDHAHKWWQLMKSRMRTREDGKYFVWNYWEPAGPWDLKGDGSPRHWVGVHPNGGYYEIDVEGMVGAFEAGLAFTKEDIDRLRATNRDFMWNQQVTRARFQRIDGGAPDPRWKDSPGALWTALVPYDGVLRKIFLANHNPASWGGLGLTTWFLAREAATR